MKGIVVLFLIAAIGSKASEAGAFRFGSPEEGRIVAAGSTLKIRVDPQDLPPLFGVLLSSDRGIIKAQLASTMPYEWIIEIPITYYGPLTLWAIGRRYIPVPNPPQATVTIHVVFPVLPLEHRPGQEGATPIKAAQAPQTAPPGRGSPGQGPPEFPADPASHSSR